MLNLVLKSHVSPEFISASRPSRSVHDIGGSEKCHRSCTSLVICSPRICCLVTPGICFILISFIVFSLYHNALKSSRPQLRRAKQTKKYRKTLEVRAEKAQALLNFSFSQHVIFECFRHVNKFDLSIALQGNYYSHVRRQPAAYSVLATLIPEVKSFAERSEHKNLSMRRIEGQDEQI